MCQRCGRPIPAKVAGRTGQITGHRTGKARKRSVIVRKFVRSTANKIGFRVCDKSNRQYGFLALPNSLANPVHSVHYSTGTIENDRIAQIDFINQSHVLQQRSASWRIPFMLVPVRFIQFGNISKLDVLDRKVAAQLNQPANVPGEQTVIGLSKVILRANHPRKWVEVEGEA